MQSSFVSSFIVSSDWSHDDRSESITWQKQIDLRDYRSIRVRESRDRKHQKQKRYVSHTSQRVDAPCGSDLCCTCKISSKTIVSHRSYSRSRLKNLPALVRCTSSTKKTCFLISLPPVNEPFKSPTTRAGKSLLFLFYGRTISRWRIIASSRGRLEKLDDVQKKRGYFLRSEQKKPSN